MKIALKRLFTQSIALALGILTGPAMAFTTVPVPEPGTLSLLGMAGAVAAVIAIRNRRK